MSRCVMMLGWLAVIGCLGCNSASSPATSTSQAAPSSAQELPDEKAEVIDSGEYYDLCRQIERDALDPDVSRLNNVIDYESLFQRASQGIDFSKKDSAKMVSTLRAAMESEGIIGAIRKEIGNEGTWRFLSLRKQRGKYYAWFRMQSNSGLNYHLLLLGKTAAGELKVQDIYMMIAGEYFSALIRPFVEQDARELARQGLMKFVTPPSDLVKNLDKVEQLQTHFRSGQFDACRKVYESLPPSVQAVKSMQIMYLVSCAKLEDFETYDRVLQTIRERDPADGSLDLHSLDTYLNAKQFDACLESIDRVERIVGGDPQLMQLRSNVCLKKPDFAAAQAYAEKLRNAPGYELEGYWQLLAVAITQRQHAETLKLLTLMEREFAIEFDDLSQAPDYAHFVQSAEYQQWLQRTKPTR